MQTFPRDVQRGRDVQVGTTFGEGPPPKIWEGKKRLKFGTISDNFEFDREYLRNENRKSSWSTTTPPMLEEKKLVNFGPQTKQL